MANYPIVGSIDTVQQNAGMLVNMEALIRRKDIGLIVGAPASEWESKFFSSSLDWLCSSSNDPPTSPYRRDSLGRHAVLAQPSLPQFDVSKVTWRQLKNAVGGSNGWIYGDWSCKLTWNNGSNTTVYASTKKGADEVATAINNICTLPLLQKTFTEFGEEGERKTGGVLKKRRVRVYPTWVDLKISKPAKRDEKGKATRHGRKGLLNIRIPLYTEDEPPQFKEAKDLAKVFKKLGDKAFI